VIVVVSHEGDEHAPPVLRALRRRRAEAVVVDLADFPRRADLALRFGGRSAGAEVRTPSGRVRAGAITAVWWRRPQPFDVGRGLRYADAAFAFRQVKEAMAGFAASLDATWVNDPWREAAADHKPFQLSRAMRSGLAVPPTLVTNDPARARAFVRARGRRRTVHKALHATADDWRPTRLIGPDDLARIDGVRQAPLVLQEYVPGVDVRVTVVGDQLFAAEIDARDTASPEDFRPVWQEARIARCELPGPVERGIRTLVAGLGLRYAAVDLRRRHGGEHLFLEVNSSGQWLFVEERTGQPITAALARLLAGR
jgi:glutathione synthase/RimK-type ligase-like ATP-grasp enzyme